MSINNININEELPIDITLNNKYNKLNIINDIQEISNIYPNNLTKYKLHASERLLISKIRSDAFSICRNKIPSEYIHYAFNNFKNGYIYYYNNKPHAFCIWDIRKHMNILNMNREDKLYIYLICGKKVDYQLVPRILDDVIQYCRKNNISNIILQPANDQLRDYYIKCGFIDNDSNNSNTLQLDINNARILTKNRKYKLYTRKHRNHTQ
jgi:hypothetical protein